MLRSILCFVIFLCLLSLDSALGQQSPSAGSNIPPVEELLKKADQRRLEYAEAFKELHAEETQTTEEYGDKGLKKRRVIVSDLIIHQSPLNDFAVVEYRNVRSIDGKVLSGRDKRAVQLFERVAKSSDLKNELEGIDRESRRFDLNTSFYGYTLHQGLPLVASWAEYFRYNVIGVEQIEGRPVIAIQYQQISQIPDVVNKLSMPSKLTGAQPMYRGRVWLDRDTFRLRREERELTLEHPSLKSPLVIINHEFNYADGPFGILTPTRFAMTSFTRGRTLADGTPELSVGGKVIYEYSPFRRFEVTQDYKPSK